MGHGHGKRSGIGTGTVVEKEYCRKGVDKVQERSRKRLWERSGRGVGKVRKRSRKGVGTV